MIRQALFHDKRERMACPLGATTGFLEVTGPISPTQIKSIEINGSSLIFQFAPRTTPPTMVGNHIDEDPQNTLLYKGIRYGLIDVQINQQTQRGFTMAPGEVVFEVNITFGTTQAPPTYPSMVVLTVPVFAAKEEYHAGYFGQLVDTDLPAASLQTLFFDNDKDTLATSFSYQTCIELIGTDGAPQSFSARVFVFSMGAAMSQQDSANLAAVFAKQAGGSLPLYQLPVGYRGTMQTVLAFNVDDEGDKIPTELSADGQISVMPISPVSDDFKNTIQFFKKPPVISGGFSDKQCPYYTTTQYKCVPFSTLNDLSGNQVVMNGQSLAQVIDQQQGVINQGTTSTGGAKIFVIVIAVIIGSILAGLVLLPLMGSLLARLFQSNRGQAAAAAARAAAIAGVAVAAGAAGAAGVTGAGISSATPVVLATPVTPVTPAGPTRVA